MSRLFNHEDLHGGSICSAGKDIKSGVLGLTQEKKYFSFFPQKILFKKEKERKPRLLLRVFQPFFLCGNFIFDIYVYFLGVLQSPVRFVLPCKRLYNHSYVIPPIFLPLFCFLF